MHAPALGSAAATLAVSFISFLWPPAPDTQMRAASILEGPNGGSLVHPRAQQSAASDRLLWELDCTGRCEIPRGRATVHWMEYLEFRRVAGAATQSRQRIREITLLGAAPLARLLGQAPTTPSRCACHPSSGRRGDTTP
jgi:hypothetical protein